MRRSSLLQFRMARTWLAGILLLIPIVAGCSGRAQEVEPTPIPTPIVPEKPTYTVERGTVSKVLELRGRVTPVKQQDLFFKTDGLVQAVSVERGDRVAAGQLLAGLGDPERFLADVAAAQLAVEQARFDLEALRRNAPVQAAEAQLALVEAEQALEQVRGVAAQLADGPTTDELVVEKARADYATAEKAFQAAQKAYDKVAHRPETDPERVLALNALLAARQRRDQALALLNWYTRNPSAGEIAHSQAEISLAEAQYQLAKETWDRLKAGPDPEELHLEEAKLSNAEAQLSLAQKNLAAVELRAPFDGEILSIGIAPGSQVSAFQLVMTLADPNDLEVAFVPSPEEAAELSVGQAVMVQLAGQPGVEFPGSLRQLPFTGISQSVGSESTGQSVRVALEAEDAPLVMGELAMVVVQVDRKENVLWLPPGALRTFQGRDFVIIQDGEVQRRVDVVLGLQSKDRVEIREGLDEGLVVIGP